MDEKLCGIYKIVNKVNGNFYVGSSSDINWRFYIHKRLLRKNQHFNIHLQRAWNKYGEDNFEFSVYQLLDKDKCLMEEQKLIDENYGKKCFYNLDKYSKLTNDEVNRRRSLSLKGRKWSDEQRKNASISQKNKKITQKIIDGWKRSGEFLIQYRQEHWDDVEQKRIDGCIGSKKSDEWKEKMSKIMTGRIITDEWRKHISEAQKGVPKKPRSKEHQERLNAANRGKKRSKETCEKLSIALKKYYASEKI